MIVGFGWGLETLYYYDSHWLAVMLDKLLNLYASVTISLVALFKVKLQSYPLLANQFDV